MKTYIIKYSPDHGDNIYELEVEAGSLSKARAMAFATLNSWQSLDEPYIDFKTFLEWLECVR